jgi:hypothetical protein
MGENPMVYLTAKTHKNRQSELLFVRYQTVHDHKFKAVLQQLNQIPFRETLFLADV